MSGIGSPQQSLPQPNAPMTRTYDPQIWHKLLDQILTISFENQLVSCEDKPNLLWHLTPRGAILRVIIWVTHHMLKSSIITSQQKWL